MKTRKQIEKMILELISQVDYDIYKGFLPEYCEEPEEMEEKMSSLVEIVRKHMK